MDEEEDGELEKKQKKKKKKKNKNNQKERLRMKRGEKDQLEKKVQAQGVYQGCGTDPCCVVPATVAGGDDGSVGKEGDEDQLEKKAQPQQEEKGWVVSAPCGNVICNENAKHRCNKCKKIGFCCQECFEESGHPGRCSGRNEK